MKEELETQLVSDSELPPQCAVKLKFKACQWALY